MIQTLIKSGDSVCLVLDQSILDHLNLSAGDNVDLRLEGQQLIISPIAKSSALDPAFLAALAYSNARFGATYKKLAETDTR